MRYHTFPFGCLVAVVLTTCLPVVHAYSVDELCIEGRVSAVLSDGALEMLDGHITVDVVAAKLDGLDSLGEITAGMVVEAEGKLVNGKRLLAAKIEFEAEDEEASNEIEGVVDQVAGDESWLSIAGFVVNRDPGTSLPAGTRLSAGQFIEATVEIEAGGPVAVKIAVEDDED